MVLICANDPPAEAGFLFRGAVLIFHRNLPPTILKQLKVKGSRWQ